MSMIMLDYSIIRSSNFKAGYNKILLRCLAPQLALVTVCKHRILCKYTTMGLLMWLSRMAFFSRIGSLVRQTNGNASVPSMLNAIRSMSSSKLFIGGLSYNTSDDSLKDAFSGFGEVIEARVIMDRDTGRSRGFGFVSFNDTESADSALSAMDGQELQGRNIRVSHATERAPRSNFGGGNSGYRGGYGGAGADEGF